MQFEASLSHDRTEEFVEGGPTGRLADTRGGGGGGGPTISKEETQCSIASMMARCWPCTLETNDSFNGEGSF